MASAALNAVVCGFFVGRHAPPLLRRAPAISMGGVSDRMANDGLLYDGWGADGMAMLNTTASLQQQAEDMEISRYDQVLLVAQRAKENAYQSAEEETGPGYLGSSFGGPMGAGMRKPLPAKSQVVSAIEELLEEVQTTGELPDLVTPGTPPEELPGYDDAEAAAAEAAAAADAAEEDDERMLEMLLEEVAFDDEAEEEEEAVDEAVEAAMGDVLDLFQAVGDGGDGGIEASGMSPGDGG